MAMEDNPTTLSDRELRDFFRRLFPDGFAGEDVVKQVAPEGWNNSPLFACFHASPEQVLAECVSRHRRHQKLIALRLQSSGKEPESAPSPEPTMADVMADWEDRPVNITDELTAIVGACLWDIFSDNHKVVAGDGRAVDIGSFRGASAFLAECLRDSKQLDDGAEYQFYLGTIWFSERADCTPVYRMIFRRLNLVGANWEYDFPQLHLVDVSQLSEFLEKPEAPYSASEAFAKDHEERQQKAELEKARGDLQEANIEARREAMDEPPPSTVRAYRQIYGHDPKGWPPICGLENSLLPP